jgi:hypothetical protein
MATVFLASIDHKHGTNRSLHRTEAAAMAEVYDYVVHWWDFEDGMPEDRAEAIGAYFEAAEDEFYAVEPLELKDEDHS